MASITISRGTPFSAASWVMAVTNSLFMLARPPLFQSLTTKEVGATHFSALAGIDRLIDDRFASEEYITGFRRRCQFGRRRRQATPPHPASRRNGVTWSGKTVYGLAWLAPRKVPRRV